MSTLGLTIVVPCRNEAARVDEFVPRLAAVADAVAGPDGWELLVVDDASTDDTAARVLARAAADARVGLVRATIGTGKGAAVRAGMLAARGRLTFVTDADLAGVPEQLGTVIAALGDDAAAVTGSRVLPGAVVHPPRPLGRRLPAALFRIAARRALAIASTDPQCGFKLFRTAAVRPAVERLRTDGFAYELELLRRIATAGGEVVDVPIRWSEGRGSSVRVLADGARMARDVAAIRRRLRRERRGAAHAGLRVAGEPRTTVASERPALSVVMPLYNELAVIDAVLDELTEQVLDVPAVIAAGGAEVIVVDDRGTDGSADRVRARAAVDARLRVLANDVNVGHGRSVLAGLDAAAGQWLLQLDSDGQVDLAGFAALWAGRDGADLWYAERQARDDPRVRLLLTRVVNALVSVLAGRRIVDANAGYKLVSASLYRHLRAGIADDTFAPSLLFVLGGQRVRARVRPFAVVHRPRRSGPSSLNLRRLSAAVALATRQTIRYATTAQPRFHADGGPEARTVARR